LSGIEFHPEAESELLAGARYYEEQAENLGLDFLAAVEASCERILQFPDIGRPFGDRLRRILVPRFPYGVIYRTEGNRTFIVAVANLYRRPGYWRTRTG
jgi:plasmid stabilization system protein ParE